MSLSTEIEVSRAASRLRTLRALDGTVLQFHVKTCDSKRAADVHPVKKATTPEQWIHQKR
jgi:hypothetical protein